MVRDRIKELRRVRAGDLIPNPRNWRQHPPAQRNALAAMLEDVGYADALLVRETPDGLELIDGHLRAETTPDQEVPVLVLDVTEEEANRLLVTLDPLAAMAQPNMDTLLALLNDTAFNDQAVKDMLEALANGETQPMPFPGNTDPDAVPQAPEEPYVKVGDLWRLGDNQIFCGDARVSALLPDGLPRVVFTDPPYGIAYEDLQRKHRRIRGDESTQLAHDTFLDAITGLKVEAWFVCCNWQSLETFRSVMQKAGNTPKAVIVWDKVVRIQNLDRFYKRHELVLYAGPFGGEVTVDGDVWAIERQTLSAHPTAKPVALVERALQASSKLGDKVYDPFLGSGTTLVACERLGRICYGMEIEPQYVQVAIERWQNYTGREAVKVD